MNKENAYEVWAMAIDPNADDYFDSLIGTFDDENVALWFFNNYPFAEKVNNPSNTRITLEFVEYEHDGSGTCTNLIAEMELN